MSLPIAPASRMAPPPSPPEPRENHPRGPAGMNWGDSALTAPITPHTRLPHVDRSKVDPKIVQAAEGMETMFLDYLMKVMRETVPKNDMDLRNAASEIYQGMLDQEYSQKAAKAGGVGLADTIIAYMDPQSYTLEREPQKAHAGKPTRGTGGTR